MSVVKYRGNIKLFDTFSTESLKSVVATYAFASFDVEILMLM